MKALALSLLLLAAPPAGPVSAPRRVDPTWMHAKIPQVQPASAVLASATAQYRPLFGEAADWASLPKHVSRYGHLTIEPGGRSAVVSFPREEHILVVLDGEGTLTYGAQQRLVRKYDYAYVPPGVQFALASRNNQRVRTMVMGYRIPPAIPITMPAELMMDNLENVPPVLVSGHPPSATFRLLLGDTTSTRDRISSGHMVTSLFVLEVQPNGTNFPHHHETEEEIYMVLEGTGEIVAGGGVDGVEGRRPAIPGDTYYYRPNATVGFYAGASPARILAIRSRVIQNR